LHDVKNVGIMPPHCDSLDGPVVAIKRKRRITQKLQAGQQLCVLGAQLLGHSLIVTSGP
jgi:hypothetical protein